MTLTVGLELLGLFHGRHAQRCQNPTDLNQCSSPLLPFGLLGLRLQRLLLGAELLNVLVEIRQALTHGFARYRLRLLS